MALRRNIEVLVADDMAVSRQVLVQMLEQLGVETVRTASSGADALHSLDQQPADILIADLHMPGLDGLQLLQKIRNHRRHCQMGFILASGDDDNGKIADAWHQGLDRFLPKPFEMQRLVQCLEAVAGRI